MIHKPREVRDLVNEMDQPGISQGKLLVVVDIVEEVLVEDSPPMDIKVSIVSLFVSVRRVVLIKISLETISIEQ